VRVAVAASVAPAFDEIAAAVTEETGARVTITAGATGKLFAQIAQGAPFDVLLAADGERPERAERDGLAVSGSRFCYALGRLALVGAEDQSALRGDVFAHLAIADPAVAPYGVAAMETLEQLGLRAQLERKLVRGRDVGQAMQFVDSGAAEFGFVAVSQVVQRRDLAHWRVPADLHAPIRHEAVLLAAAKDNAQARALLAFLRGPRAQALLEAHGYLPAAE
jgi:molybdate transport system substrate-binding protein